MTRTFVPEGFNIDDVDAVKGILQQLLDAEIPPTKDGLRNWLMQWSEVMSVGSEIENRRYVASTCNTQDEAAQKALEFITNEINPIMSDFDDKLNRKFLSHPCKDELREEFDELIKATEMSIQLFRKDNIPISRDICNEIQHYQSITGSMSVEMEGQQITLAKANSYLENTDRSIREDAFRKIWECRMSKKDELDESFDKMFKLRIQKAKNSGCKDFIDFIYKVKDRPYTPQHCKDFADTVEKVIIPVTNKLSEERAKSLGIEVLRPWDYAVDVLGREPLKPYSTYDELVDKVDRIFESIHPQAGAWAREMQAKKLIDVENRIGKAPGGYQISFDESRLPFIFMNATESDQDIYTLLHESGHSFHEFNQASQECYWYRGAPSEFAEVASMSMELIGMTKLGEFYNEEDMKRSIKDKLTEILTLFAYIASIDTFQHEIYRRENHTAQDRADIWLGLMERFYPDANPGWAGLEQYRRIGWQRILHIFECPFYMIEYGIAQLGAMQVYANYLKDPNKAIEDLFRAEKLGGSRPVNELFEAANIKFDFTEKTIEPVVAKVVDMLEAI